MKEISIGGVNHVIRMRRYERADGRLPHGYKLKCHSCGWECHTNEGKEKAIEYALQHLKQVKENS